MSETESGHRLTADELERIESDPVLSVEDVLEHREDRHD